MTIFIVVLVCILIFVICEYNMMLSKRNKVKQARASIDVYLTQRFDLIPNLVSCVKGYMEYEKGVIEKITELRAQYNQSKNLETGVELNRLFNNLVFANEKYPELKANEQFLNLQKNIEKMEKQLQAARRLYNTDVTTYNNSIAIFPANILAGVFGFKEEKLFELEELKKENININL